jgi:hypothetical protein
LKHHLWKYYYLHSSTSDPLIASFVFLSKSTVPNRTWGEPGKRGGREGGGRRETERESWVANKSRKIKGRKGRKGENRENERRERSYTKKNTNKVSRWKTFTRTQKIYTLVGARGGTEGKSKG